MIKNKYKKPAVIVLIQILSGIIVVFILNKFLNVKIAYTLKEALVFIISFTLIAYPVTLLWEIAVSSKLKKIKMRGK
jgi:hypothetical protein